MAMRLSLPAAYSWQPQTVPNIANNGLTKDILDAILPFGTSCISVSKWKPDAITPFTRVTSGDYPLRAFHKFGAAIEGNGTAHCLRTGYTPPQLNATTPFSEWSMMVLVTPTSITSANRYIFSYSHTNASALNFGGFYQDTSARVGFFMQGGTAASYTWRYVTGPAWWANNTPVLLIMSRSKSRATAQMWANGLPVALTNSDSGNKGDDTTTLSKVAVCNLILNGTNYPFPGKISLAVSWTRAIFDAEAAQLSANPWQIFDYPSRPLFLDQAAAAAFLARQGLNIQQAVNRASTF